jgi:hypothetical protein
MRQRPLLLSLTDRTQSVENAAANPRRTKGCEKHATSRLVLVDRFEQSDASQLTKFEVLDFVSGALFVQLPASARA